MASFTTTETRLSTNVPFFFETPFFADFYQRMNTAFEGAGISLATEVAPDNLSVKYIRTFSEDKTLTFKSIFETYVEELRVIFEENNFPFAYQEFTSRQFDSARTEGIYNGTITL